MSKVTKKLQVNVPKEIVRQYQIQPGDEIEWMPAGEVIRVLPQKSRQPLQHLSQEERLRLFDLGTQRQKERNNKKRPLMKQKGRSETSDRGWQREELYRNERSG